VALSVAAAVISGRWVKHTYPGSLPLPEREPPPDNRWQRGEVVDALYLADSNETAWAEWYRHLAERMIPPLAQMPRELWTWRVRVEVADLSTPERLTEVGLRPPTPDGSSWPAYQRIGERLAKDGWVGLIAPSAARPAGKVLCLFRTADGVRGAQPLPPPKEIGEPPPPPTGLRT
jgi:RES domain-containing protein